MCGGIPQSQAALVCGIRSGRSEDLQKIPQSRWIVARSSGKIQALLVGLGFLVSSVACGQRVGNEIVGYVLQLVGSGNLGCSLFDCPVSSLFVADLLLEVAAIDMRNLMSEHAGQF